MSRSRPCTLALLASVSLSTAAYAAPCGRPDVDSTFPPDGAQGVPPNALLTAHYGSPARYDDEPVTLRDSGGNEVALALSYDDADSRLRATPAEPLSSGHFELTWPGLRGVSSSGGLGRGRAVGFTVEGPEDAAPPVFSGLSQIEWDLSRERDPCLDKLDDRFVFALGVGQASDDAGVALLSLLVFQTRDPSAPAGSEPSRVGLQAWPEDGKVRIRRPATHAGQTCFAAIATDLVGRVSGGGDHEVCVKTQLPPFFDGCAVAPGAPLSPRGASGAWLALLGLAWRRRRRGPDAQTPLAA